MERKTRLLSAVAVGIAALLIIGGWVVAGPVRRLARAAEFLENLTATSDDAFANVIEEPFDVPDEPVRLSGRLYRKKESTGPLPALVVCHGAAESGMDDPRFVRLGRSLAAVGAVVFTPDIVDLRELRIDPATIERVVAAVEGLAGRPDIASGGRAGLLGISFAGTYCLLAARDPRIRDRVACVVSFGGYDDLSRLVGEWLRAPPSGTPGVYPVESYGKWIVLDNNLEALAPPSDREFLHRTLDALIARGETDRVPTPASLSPAGRRLYEAAVSTGPVDAVSVEEILASSRDTLRALSLDGKLQDLRCPAFLLHAASDRLIPERESAEVAKKLEGVVSTRLLVTDLFEHVTIRGDEARKTGFFEALPLLRFAAAVLDACAL